MTDLDNLVPPLVLQHLTAEEKEYLTQVFIRFNGYPNLEQVWQLMDEQWVGFGCDPTNMDERVTVFYRHPVWMLNGLFIEQHPQSLENRRVFTDWVTEQAPARVADFGGGFGGLARFIGQALPAAQVEVVDPHPHAAAIELAATTPNVRFVPELTDTYDMLIATDVFEHVPDPIGLAAETATHLRLGGQYLIANCFQPVILCHLPQLFHLHYGWDHAMARLGLRPGPRVGYGRAYIRLVDLDVSRARKVAACARRLYPWIEKLPRGKTKLGKLLMPVFC
jgi:SAM-dependent methyltransferase